MATTPIAAPGYGREQLRSLTGDVWRAFRWVRDRDLFFEDGDDAQNHLSHEAAAQDLLSRLFYSLDAANLTTAASLFTANANMDGDHNVRRRLESRALPLKFSRHRFVNTVTRVLSAALEMWLTCYVHQARIHTNGEVDSEYSRCVARFELQDGDWRFADLLLHVDLVQRYGIEADMVAIAPQVTDKVEPERATRAFSAHRSPAFDGGRTTWNELREDVWAAHHWFADQSDSACTSSEERLQRLVDHMLIRELLANYAYAHDSRDLAWTASNFNDDAILINDTLRFEGNSEVIEAFRGFNRRMTVSFHRFSNPRVKFVSAEEAWFVAYYHVPAIGPGGRNQYSFGRYFSRLTKRSGRWQIADWRIANDPTVLPMEIGS